VDGAAPADAVAAAAACAAQAAATVSALEPLVLGTLAPDESMPLPWACTREYPLYELQLRPLCLPGRTAQDGAPVAAPQPHTRWSVALPGGAVTQLGALQGETAQLVACADGDDSPSADSPRTVRPPAPGCHAFWLALSAASTAVRAGLGCEATDWRLVVGAPLSLENLTSAPACYRVWEGHLGAPPASYRLAQAGTLPSGACVAVHGADPRRATFLSWSAPAEGFEPLLGAPPALLFPPLRAGDSCDPPDGRADLPPPLPNLLLHLARPSDAAILEMRVEREESGRGCLRCARVSTAFLLINRTRLPIGYWLTALTPEEKAAAAAAAVSDEDERGARGALSVLEVSTEAPALWGAEGAAARYQGECRLSAGTMGMLAPPGVPAADAALRLRVAGSGPSAPISLAATTPTLVNAVLPDKRLAQVLVAAEPGGGRFARTTVITVDHRVTLSNRTGERVSVKQTGIPEKQMPGRSQWAAPLILQPGDAGVPLIWDDYLKTPALELGLEGARWSRALSVAQGEAHVVLSVRDDSSAGGGSAAPARVVHLSAEQAATGRVHVALRSACAPPPVRIENSTGCALAARQAATLQGGTAWALLPPHANVAQPWECSWGAGVPAAIELRVPKRTGESVVVTGATADTLRVTLQTAADGAHQGASTRGMSLVLPDGRRASVRVRCEGAVRVVCVAVDSATARSLALAAPASQAQAQAATELELSVQLLEVKLSVVDHAPQELLLLSLDRLSYCHATGLACGRASRTDVRIAALQVDDQSPNTSFPVLLWHSTSDQSDALLRFALTETHSGGDAQLSLGEKTHPGVALELTAASLHLRIHEPLIWRLLTFAEKLRLSRGSHAPADAQHSAATPSAATSSVVYADPLVTIGSLALSGASARITFKGEPSSRPVGGVSGGLLAFANLDQAPISISPLKHEALRMRQSAIAPMLLRAISRQLTLQSVRLLTGVDILADASDTLSQISGSLASYTGDTHWQERSSSRRAVEETSMAGALVHGGEAMAAGLFRGITGVVTKPVEGARDKGLSGFITGIGRGMAGLVLQPVSGAVDLASKAVEGVNASKATVVDLVREGGSGARRRPPLAVGASGVVRRYDRKAAEGQAILRLAEWRAVGSAGGVVDRLDLFKTRSKFGRDTYEWHEELPDGRVALVTNARALLLERPFPTADLLAERCSISWTVDFADILSAAAEAPDSREGSARGGADKGLLPSAVVLQLRAKSKERMLSGSVAARTFQCAPGTEQAQRLLAAIREGLRELAAQLSAAAHD
jgi:vacuolar protein sorting-associated protein 13A/C